MLMFGFQRRPSANGWSVYLGEAEGAIVREIFLLFALSLLYSLLYVCLYRYSAEAQ